MNCDEYKSRLHAYFAEELSAEEAAGVDAHAAACPPCGDLMRIAREISCRDFVAFLNRYIEGDLEPERRAVFDRHLSICPDCTAYTDSYRKAMKLSALALKSKAVPEEIPEGLLRAILDARK